MSPRLSLVLLLAVVMLAVACGESPVGPPRSRSAAVSTTEPSAASAQPPAMLATSLTRKATPSERFGKDQSGCAAGDKAACRSLAARYQGFGIQGGCGVPRGRAYPFTKREPSDHDSDRLAWTSAMHKACELGDEGACALSMIEPNTVTSTTFYLSRNPVRRDWKEIGLWLFRSNQNPAVAKKLDAAQKKCLVDSPKWSCSSGGAFEKLKAPADGKLPAELRKLAEEACAATRDCDDIYTVLDQAGFSPEELAPVRASFAKTLVEACLEGECTCGEATKYLSPDDARLSDLGVLGCENGEPEGCYTLGLAIESGKVAEPKSPAETPPSDAVTANKLFDAACPLLYPSNGKLGDYSTRACDRFAERYLSGPYPGKDRDRGRYYVELACPNPGFAWNHRPCVRLGMLWATKRTSTGKNGTEARYAAWANSDALAIDHECKRKSVKEACDEFQKALVYVK